LPGDDPELCQRLLALEVRAMGCLLQELAAHAAGDAAARLAVVAAACLSVEPAARPTMEHVAQCIRALKLQ
jgi:hypothetical protein